jgi:hypothetical protein
MHPATRYVDVRANRLKRGNRTDFSLRMSEPVVQWSGDDPP